ncbi:MAG: hypothetical protein E6614_02420 [Bradyrhizobium sp.]|jgi:hypothetical protein|uniref:hypothetical protein n=1 Tax=Bradyrhizobium TaxID=374 RepID=UPI001553FBCD|nr:MULTISPECIES: hypothetical protein [unclassified Bradyrhizobium]MDU0954219.1 hypothetical protein [Bradyrhizobium sp.]MDU1493640.1 hypothetical protein [Bradyrhizobium sp.]MDU1544067.1 hypothetical protein [Bradyrhizobium sp.]MDU1671846.1 hypothetical protein [Bradyrhizobium sp.]MDU1694242.1 hypothetical protein [Bradyrhizobium sp.]
MAKNKELEAGLKAMAEDFHLPGGGRMKLSRLVDEHLGWFAAAERRGLGWRDMTRALAAAGVTSGGGKPLSIGTLSSTVWRKRAEAEEMTDAPVGKVRSNGRQVEAPRAVTAPSGGKLVRKKPAPSLRIDDRTKAGRAAGAAPQRVVIEARANPKKDVLAFMDRARAVRRRPD